MDKSTTHRQNLKPRTSRRLDNPRIIFYVTNLWKLIMVVVFNTIYDVFDLCLSNDRQLARWRKVSSSQRRGRRSRAPPQALRRNATCPWHASVLPLMHHLLALNALAQHSHLRPLASRAWYPWTAAQCPPEPFPTHLQRVSLLKAAPVSQPTGPTQHHSTMLLLHPEILLQSSNHSASAATLALQLS
jgi:hypothetical protein